jgi:hypothetical protein
VQAPFSVSGIITLNLALQHCMMFFKSLLYCVCFLAAVVTAVPTILHGGQYSLIGSGKRDIRSTLGPELSPNAAIYTSSDPAFNNESLRWSAYSAPTFQAVVEVASEADIVASVSNGSVHLLADMLTASGQICHRKWHQLPCSGRRPWL